MESPCGVKAKLINIKVDDYVTTLEVWKVDNFKIITWVNNLVIHSIDTQLVKYDATKEV